MDRTKRIPDEFFSAVLEKVAEGVYFCDPERHIAYWNPAAERITGFTGDEVHGLSCADGLLTHVDASGAPLCEVSCPLVTSLTEDGPVETKAFLHHKEGYRVPVSVRSFPVHDDSGDVVGVAEVFTDDSPLVAALERVEQLSTEAGTDALTGIANRRGLERELEDCVDERRKTDGQVGILFIDIDHFKEINDDFGHGMGDRVLTMVTQTLKRSLRVSDTLARWGGDEFLAILRDVDSEGLQELADKLRLLVASSYLNLAGEELRVTVSMGATILRSGESTESVLARADKLLYESKSQGRDRLTWSE